MVLYHPVESIMINATGVTITGVASVRICIVFSYVILKIYIELLAVGEYVSDYLFRFPH